MLYQRLAYYNMQWYAGSPHFRNAHAATRRDDERAFEISQSQFPIGHGPTRFWGKQMLVTGEYHDGQFEHRV
jgi:hypothetical protein